MRTTTAILSLIIIFLVGTLGWIFHTGHVPTINPKSTNTTASVQPERVPVSVSQHNSLPQVDIAPAQQPAATLTLAVTDSNQQSQTAYVNAQQPVALDACGIPVHLQNTEFQVLASGTYDGVSGRSGQEFFVNVESSSKPVVLLLSGYEMLTWNIQLHPNHQVKAIAITGYHRQRAIISDPNIPVAISTYDQKSACYTDLFRFDKLQMANQVSQRLYRKPISMFYPPNSTGSVTISGIDVVAAPLAKNPVSNKQMSVPPIDNSEPPKLVSDSEGIQQALAQGLIRVATERDVEKYLEAYEILAAPLGGSLSIPPIYGGLKPNNITTRGLRGNQGYVILKNMRMPEGMGGAHAVTFILPKGIPYPKGKLGHSVLLNMNDGSCTGEARMLCDRN